MFSCEICDIFKNTCFEEHLRTTASCYSEFFQTIVALQSSEISRKHPHSFFNTAIFLIISINTFRNGCAQFYGKLVNLVSHIAKSKLKKNKTLLLKNAKSFHVYLINKHTLEMSLKLSLKATKIYI